MSDVQGINIFTRMQLAPTNPSGTGNGKGFWHKVEGKGAALSKKSTSKVGAFAAQPALNGHYFVARAYSESESAKISEGLRQPDKFIFSDKGHIRCLDNGSTLDLFNPLESDHNELTDQRFANGSLQALATQDRHDHNGVMFTWGSDMVTSRLLYYIAHRQGARWYLVYNPMHRSPFQSLYKATMADRSLTTEWVSNKAHRREGAFPAISIRNVIQAYCAQFKTHDATDKVPRYLDPTCNMTMSQSSAVSSAIQGANKVEVPNFSAMKGLRSVSNWYKSGTPPMALCYGVNHNYFNTKMQGPNGSSFLSELRIGGGQPRSKCAPNINVTFCTMNITANRMAMEGSSIANDCPSAGVADTDVADTGDATTASQQPAATTVKATAKQPRSPPEMPKTYGESMESAVTRLAAWPDDKKKQVLGMTALGFTLLALAV